MKIKRFIFVLVIILCFILCCCTEKSRPQTPPVSKQKILELAYKRMKDKDNYPTINEYLFIKFILDNMDNNNKHDSIFFLTKYENGDISLSVGWKMLDDKEDKLKITLPNKDVIFLKIPKLGFGYKINGFIYRYNLFYYKLGDLPECLKRVSTAQCVSLRNGKPQGDSKQLIVFNETDNSFENNVLSKREIEAWVDFCRANK